MATPTPHMLCKTSAQLPVGLDWAYEPKLDGFRVLVSRRGRDVQVRGRNGGRLTPRFPEVVECALRLRVDRVVLDGELIAMTSDGLDFDALLARYQPDEAEKASRRVVVSYVAFDLLAVGDEDLRGRPLRERRARLERLVGQDPVLRVGVQTDDPDVAKQWLAEFAGRGVEGVVCKKLGEPYLAGTRRWIKVKAARTLDAVVAGFSGTAEEPHGLILGLYESGALAYIGRASVPVPQRAEVFGRLTPAAESFLERGTPGRGRWERGWSQWVAVLPEHVAEVAYTALSYGMLRHTARFARWRPDRAPADCGFSQFDSG